MSDTRKSTGESDADCLFAERERIAKLLREAGLDITGTGFGMGDADIQYLNGAREYQITIQELTP